MFNLIIKSLFLYLIFLSNVFADQSFDHWLKKFQVTAIESGISKKVVYEIMSNVKFLPKVIEYDRFQPEFYEDTLTYIKKRSSIRKIKAGVNSTIKKKLQLKKLKKNFKLKKNYYLR